MGVGEREMMESRLLLFNSPLGSHENSVDPPIPRSYIVTPMVAIGAGSCHPSGQNRDHVEQ